MLRSLRFHQKMRQWEKTGWTFSRGIYRWLWCMKMLPVKKQKKTAICWLCLTPLLSLWALCTHARLNALWKSGLTPRLINVNIPQQTAHRWGLIYEHKLPVRVSLYFISRFVNGMSLVMELQSQIPAGTPFSSWLCWVRIPANNLGIKITNNLLQEFETMQLFSFSIIIYLSWAEFYSCSKSLIWLTHCSCVAL